jgi:hypothetical protein
MIKRLRAWTDAIETFVREVMLRQRRGIWRRSCGALFFPSRLFALAVKTRYLLRDRHQ